MTAALDRVFGHLVLVVVAEVLFFVLVLQNPGAWFDKTWGAFVAFGLGALGMPWTFTVPHLVTEGGGWVPAVILMVGPVVNLFLRGVGYYLRVDRRST